MRIRTAFPEANQNCLQYDRQSKKPGSHKKDAAISDASRGEIGKKWPHQRARGSARCDNREQPLRLSGVEKLNQKAPENRDQKQTQYTDENVEELRDRHILGLMLQNASHYRERDCYEPVNEREKHASPDFRDYRPIDGNDG